MEPYSLIILSDNGEEGCQIASTDSSGCIELWSLPRPTSSSNLDKPLKIGTFWFPTANRDPSINLQPFNPLSFAPNQPDPSVLSPHPLLPDSHRAKLIGIEVHGGHELPGDSVRLFIRNDLILISPIIFLDHLYQIDRSISGFDLTPKHYSWGQWGVGVNGGQRDLVRCISPSPDFSQSFIKGDRLFKFQRSNPGEKAFRIIIDDFNPFRAKRALLTSQGLISNTTWPPWIETVSKSHSIPQPATSLKSSFYLHRPTVPKNSNESPILSFADDVGRKVESNSSVELLAHTHSSMSYELVATGSESNPQSGLQNLFSHWENEARVPFWTQVETSEEYLALVIVSELHSFVFQ